MTNIDEPATTPTEPVANTEPTPPVEPVANAQPTEPVASEDNAPIDEANPLLKPQANEDGEGKEEGKEDPAPAEPVEVSDEEFAKGITAAEGVEYSIDNETVKAMTPHLKEAGLNAEQANKIANKLAEYQYAQVKKEAEARQERMRAWKPQVEAMLRENPNAPKEWQAALESVAKLDPVLVDVIRGTELGHSPAMLELLSLAGRSLAIDGGVGTQATGRGGSSRGFANVMSNGIL